MILASKTATLSINWLVISFEFRILDVDIHLWVYFLVYEESAVASHTSWRYAIKHVYAPLNDLKQVARIEPDTHSIVRFVFGNNIADPIKNIFGSFHVVP